MHVHLPDCPLSHLYLWVRSFKEKAVDVYCYLMVIQLFQLTWSWSWASYASHRPRCKSDRLAIAHNLSITFKLVYPI